MRDDVIIRFGTEAEKQTLLNEHTEIKKVIQSGGYFIVAVIEDTVIGFLWAFKREIPAPVGQSEIFVNIIEVIYTNLRRQGIASAMLNEIVKVAKNENVYQIRAFCDIWNIPSHRLWLKNRFSVSPVKMPDGSVAGSFVSYVL